MNSRTASIGFRSPRSREPDLVESTIAQAVGVTEGLARHLANRQTLLLLDNFEQVLVAAPGLSELLGVGPHSSCW